MNAESQKNIRDICVRLLSRREHSQQELLDKLVIKGFDRTEAQLIVDDLASQGWQSNQRFAESYSRYRIKKGYGPIKIICELQQRGIEDCDLDAVLIDIADSWNELLDQVYAKKYPDDKELTNKALTHKEWFKRNRFLQQRGFSGEMIKTLFKDLNIQLIYS
ncbi:MAG: regulatory protein RecX [Methylococcales bacterium]|nr:regulatory protein RecX [Methylococcales bacterium]